MLSVRWEEANSLPGAIRADSGMWQTIVFDPGTDPILGFTGNGVLSTASGKGTIEHLAFASTGDDGPFMIFIDNVEQVCEPNA